MLYANIHTKKYFSEFGANLFYKYSVLDFDLFLTFPNNFISDGSGSILG